MRTCGRSTASSCLPAFRRSRAWPVRERGRFCSEGRRRTVWLRAELRLRRRADREPGRRRQAGAHLPDTLWRGQQVPGGQGGHRGLHAGPSVQPRHVHDRPRRRRRRRSHRLRRRNLYARRAVRTDPHVVDGDDRLEHRREDGDQRAGGKNWSAPSTSRSPSTPTWTSSRPSASASFVEGIAEAIKMGVIRLPRLFELLEAHPAEVMALEPALIEQVMFDAMRGKAEVVAQDEKEAGLARPSTGATPSATRSRRSSRRR